MKRVTLLAALFAVVLPAASQTIRDAPPEIEEALRERVTGFYTHFQRGEFREAEDFVDEESKDLFYGAKKNRILNFEIQTIKYEEDFRGANVIVLCETMVPMMGSKPFAVPLGSDWRYGDEGWVMHLKDPGDAREKVAMAGSPFGQMQFSQNLPKPGDLSTQRQMAAPPTVAALERMYYVSGTHVRFLSTDSQTSRTITVENRSPGKMTIESASSKLPGVDVEISPTEIEPGGKASITFTYKPEENRLQGRHRLDFLLLPISQTVPVLLDF